MAQNYKIEQLPQIAQQVRKGILEAIFAAGSGHPGGSLGFADVLVALYFQVMNIDPSNPGMPGRDRFVLSHAHVVPALHSVLAQRGFIDPVTLGSLRQYGSQLQGHTFRNLDIGIETTGGSLGQGLSVAIGMAMADKINRQGTMADPNYHTFCAISDGELNEGQIWEAFMFLGKTRPDNLTVILDRNNIQQSNFTEQLLPLEPLISKLEAFNLNVLQVNGHSFPEIIFALQKAKLTKHKTTVVVANTVPGKGVSFMEYNWEWHGKAPNEQQFNQAITELSNAKA